MAVGAHFWSGISIAVQLSSRPSVGGTVAAVALLHGPGLAVGVLAVALVAVGIGLLAAVGIIGAIAALATFEVLVLARGHVSDAIRARGREVREGEGGQ